MRKDFGPKPWVYPQPVLIIATYDEDGVPDAMNAAWGGQYGANKIMISLSSHKTTENIEKHGAFTVSFATREQTVPADFVGLVSAHAEPQKLQKAGWHTTKSAHVDAPLIDELPMALECKFLKYNEDGILVGEIVNASIDESVLADGRLDHGKFAPIIFDPVNAEYYALGDKAGNAFSDGAKLK